MCLAVPMKITEISADEIATCQVGEGTTVVTASTALLGEAVQPGDYIIVHAGFALRKVETAEAEETLKLLREMISLAKPEDWG